MKRFALLVYLFFTISLKAAAQQLPIDSMLRNRANPEAPALPLRDVKKHIGSDVYIYEEIKGYKTINDSLRLLFIGGRYPDHILTILIKGIKVNKELAAFTNGKQHFSGTAIIYKGKPAIVVTSSLQLGTEILI